MAGVIERRRGINGMVRERINEWQASFRNVFAISLLTNACSRTRLRRAADARRYKAQENIQVNEQLS